MRLSDLKSRLRFIINSTARYRGKDREIVIEVLPDYAAVRLLGTRTRYEVSWRALFDLRAEICARRERERRKGRKESACMNYVGEYQSSTDTWIYTCAGCGREFEESDSISPLDGLGCCSAE